MRVEEKTPSIFNAPMRLVVYKNDSFTLKKIRKLFKHSLDWNFFKFRRLKSLTGCFFSLGHSFPTSVLEEFWTFAYLMAGKKKINSTKNFMLMYWDFNCSELLSWQTFSRRANKRPACHPFTAASHLIINRQAELPAIDRGEMNSAAPEKGPFKFWQAEFWSPASSPWSRRRRGLSLSRWRRW